MWRLYNTRMGEAIPPRDYGYKDQSDLVREVLDAFESYDIVLLQGAVGTGKSVIALHIIAEYLKGIIQTPTKALEEQYHRDYEMGEKQILLDNGKPLKIRGIRGRANFLCPYKGDVNCGSRKLPCTRQLKEGETRFDAASECKYWSPIYSIDFASRTARRFYSKGIDVSILEYDSFYGKKGIVTRSEICPYYKQYLAYTEDSVALVMNSALWEIETFVGRKPKVLVEIIDEADAYLDSLCLQVRITRSTLKKYFKKYEDIVIKEDPFLINNIWESFDDLMAFVKEKTKKRRYHGPPPDIEAFDSLLKGLKVFNNITNTFARLPIVISFLNRAYVDISLGMDKKKGDDKDKDRVIIYISEPSFTLRELRKRSARKWLLMSATFQKAEVLDEIFGIDDYGICIGDMRFPGTIYARRTGKEMIVTHKKWEKEIGFVERYCKVRDEIISKATPPKLIQVWGKRYLEGLDINSKSLRDTAIFEEDKDEMWSTVANRGVDLPDDKCRSIILLKYPLPKWNDPVLQTLRKKVGEEAFQLYYHDIAERNLVQQVGRGIRHENDWCEVWSPDLKVFEALVWVWKGKIVW